MIKSVERTEKPVLSMLLLHHSCMAAERNRCLDAEQISSDVTIGEV